MTGRFTFKFTTGPLAGRSYSLGPGELLYFGSDSECGVCITDDSTISPRHACVHYSLKGDILFKDLQTPHGTRINGKMIKRTVKLKPGQRITLGQHTTFQCGYWDALQSTRFTQIAMRKFSAMAQKGSVILRLNRDATPTPRSLIKITSMILGAGSVLGVILYVVLTRENSELKQAAKAPSADERAIMTHSESSESGLNPNSHFVWDEIVNISRRFGDTPPSAMDRAFLAQVEMWIERFTKNGLHRTMIKRREKYWPDIENILRRFALPTELGYVVWVESGFNPAAESNVGAAGLWQIMPETAREYGLRVALDQRIDERQDPLKSTVAAAKYFQTLLRMFGTDRYLLALASYNTGQNRVARSKIAFTVRRARKADFWHLHDQLPQETVDYVPKIIAAIIVGRNPDRW